MSFKSPAETIAERNEFHDRDSYVHQCRNVSARLDRVFNGNNNVEIPLHSTSYGTAARIARELREKGWYVTLESSGIGFSHCLHVSK